MRRRGFTLVELLTGMSLVALLVLGSMALLIGSLRSFQRTDGDVTMNDATSRSVRKITETLRSAVSVTITNNGRTLSYRLPALTNGVDPVTGEREVAIPPASDGVVRSYNVDFGSGRLTDETGRVLVRNISSRDTEPGSTLFNSAYEPFALVTIGSRKGLTVNLIASDSTSGRLRTARIKTSTILRNVP